MRFSSFLVGSLFFAVGCSTSTADQAAPPPVYGDGEPAGAGIVYEGESPLTLAPGERASLSFSVRPKDGASVRFALVGDFGDASLDADRKPSTSDGEVSVELFAPSSSRTFLVRASLDSGAFAEVPISVSGLGFGSIEVVPVYSGSRSIHRWTATVATGTTCAELVGNPPPDGPLVSEATPPSHPTVHAAPVGPALVVTVRAGHFAGGCLDVKDLVVFEQKRVTIPLDDRPLDLSEAELSVRLSFGDEDRLGKLAFFDEATERLKGAFVEEGAEGLLDRMRQALPEGTGPGFDTAREIGHFDALLDAFLDQRGTTPRGLLVSWIEEGRQGLDFASGLEGWLRANGTKDQGLLEPSLLLGVGSGSISPATVSFSATPGDRIQFGGTTTFSEPALLLGAVAQRVIDEPWGAPHLGEPLAKALSCEEVGELLAGGHPVQGCADGCLIAACEQALARYWEEGLSKAGPFEAETTLSFTVTGVAEIDDHARISGFSGGWVGGLQAGERSLSVKSWATGR